jgi:hypothetical protein
LHRLCRDLLSNPVIEDYELQNTDRGNYKKRSNSDKSGAGVEPASAVDGLRRGEHPTRLRNQPSRKAVARREATARQAPNVEPRKKKAKKNK